MKNFFYFLLNFLLTAAVSNTSRICLSDLRCDFYYCLLNLSHSLQHPTGSRWTCITMFPIVLMPVYSISNAGLIIFIFFLFALFYGLITHLASQLLSQWCSVDVFLTWKESDWKEIPVANSELKFLVELSVTSLKAICYTKLKIYHSTFIVY